MEILSLLSLARWCSGQSEGSATWATWWSMTSASCTAPLLFLQTSRAHLSSTPALTAAASLRTTCATSSTTAETTPTRTPTSAVRPPLMSDWWHPAKDPSRMNGEPGWITLCIAVFQRASVGAAALSLTSVPGVSADGMSLIGGSKWAAPPQLAPGRQVTTPWETPRGTTSTWRAPSPRQSATPPEYQDPYWAAGAHSARWDGGQRAVNSVKWKKKVSIQFDSVYFILPNITNYEFASEGFTIWTHT